VLRDGAMTLLPATSNAISVDVPGWTGEWRARLDAVFGR
jgi:hypothetical protein